MFKEVQYSKEGTDLGLLVTKLPGSNIYTCIQSLISAVSTTGPTLSNAL